MRSLRSSVKKSAEAVLKVKPDISQEELTKILKELYIDNKKEVPLATACGIVDIPNFRYYYLFFLGFQYLYYRIKKLLVKPEKSKKEVDEIIKSIVQSYLIV